MPRSLGRKRRDAIVADIRQQGHDAFLAGKTRNANPYKPSYPDHGQWARGYDSAQMDAEPERSHD